ncbi:hypothetical protein TNCV_1186541 [Trichonephila clavipes]|nr:hypothetical protein TNCV_1186541 [Trichonephila clavipes]
MTEKCQRETASNMTLGKVITRLQSSRIRYNPADDYSLIMDILIGTMTEVCPNCKALKFNGETKGMFCTTRKIKVSQL